MARRGGPRAGGQAWIRPVSAALVLAWVGAARWIEPAHEARAALHAYLVFALGYGHLLASVVRGQRRRAGGGAAPWRTALLCGALGGGYATYIELCRAWPLLPLGLLAISAWHTVENDRALHRGCLDDAAPIAPLSRSARDHAVDGLGALLLSALAFAAARGTTRIDVADVVAALSLHHLVTWLALVFARAWVRRRLAAELCALARLHAPTIGICVAAIFVLESRATAGDPVAETAALLLSPATYLFWSAAHVVHTGWRRA